MDSVITEYPAEIVSDKEVDEIDSLLTPGVIADILDVPVNTYKGWANYEELSLLHIVWD